jgi:methylenetetrahydrofolate reductase (NADH)
MAAPSVRALGKTVIMNAPVLLTQNGGGPERQRIAAFAARASFEVTRLEPGDLEALRANVAPGTPLYITAVPKRAPAAQIEAAVRIAGAGFEPVPHVAARGFANAADLDRHLGLLADGAGVRRVLVIGGDLSAAAGPFLAALEVIDSGLLQARGILEVGIAGYPQGHPRRGAAEMERALNAKIEAAMGTGLGVHIVTQFCFSAPAILAWIGRLRDQGIELPVRIGLAGPSTLSGLLRFARICGVAASARGLVRHTGLAKQLFGLVTPDSVLRPLAEAAAGRTSVAPHIFPFGGLLTAVRWAAAAAAGRFTLDHDDGFTVEPP